MAQIVETQVGDRYRVTGNLCTDTRVGDEIVVTETYGDTAYFDIFSKNNPNEKYAACSHALFDNQVEKINEDPLMNGTIVEKLRNLNLTNDDRLLRKYGITDAQGNITEDGKSALVDLLFKANRKEVIAELQKLDDELTREEAKK